jgi:integrase
VWGAASARSLAAERAIAGLDGPELLDFEPIERDMPRPRAAARTQPRARRCERAGVRRITIHDTRRTCGSLLAALDVHPRVAMAILRHSRIALTMEIYTQVPDASTRAALRRLSDLLGDPHSDEPAAPANDTGAGNDQAKPQ